MKAGTVLAGRYVVEEPAPLALADASAFYARDSRLDRPVVAVVVERDDGAVRVAAERARVARDARLARVVDIVDDESGGVLIVVERPAGVPLERLLSRTLVPRDVAGALVGETIRALQAAARLGLSHGAIVPGWVTVTPRGKVVVGGAGVVPAIVAASGGAPAGERADARAAAALFARAVTGRDRDDLTPDALPDGLPLSERRLVASVARGSSPSSLSDVAAILQPWDATLLEGLSLRSTLFAPHPDAARAGRETLPGEPAASVDASLETVSGVVAEESVSLESADSGVAAATDLLEGEEIEEDDDWGFGRLEPLVEPTAVPSIAEAFAGFLRRRVPHSEAVARAIERAHTIAKAGPRLRAGWWVGVAAITAVVIGLIVAVRGVLAPVGPPDGYDPYHHDYPDFTFGPSPTPSS